MRLIQISEEAFDDLSDGNRFYEAQDQGLGDYFTSCLRADIESLRLYAGTHRIVYKDYHRLLSRVFPFAIFYTVEPNAVMVWAVLDMRRDPSWIKARLSQ